MKTDVLVIIPTNKKPPVLSVKSFTTKRQVVVLADPAVVEQHRDWVSRLRIPNVGVAVGKVGQAAQKAYTYRYAHRLGFSCLFRMDDDLHERVFIGTDGSFKKLDFVIDKALDCMNALNVTMVGFANTSNPNFLKDRYSLGWGHIHGGATLVRSFKDSAVFFDESLTCYTDVYETLVHRNINDGFIGRVSSIGFDKRRTVVQKDHSSALVIKTQDIIRKRFPDMISEVGFDLVRRKKAL